ncbi:MAG: SLBB domain-containing protein [Actinomycetota bacterium]|nr:SLBB domain-containing protein [Actinomycetota bacterium]
MSVPVATTSRAAGDIVSVVSDERTLLPSTRVTSVRKYLESGGGVTLDKALSLPRTEVIEVVRQAGLRGRGGAGFPAAAKWGGLLRDQDGVKYVCCNAAEGEPATFKDRLLIRTNPYRVIEGLAIAAYAAGAEGAFIVTKRTFTAEIDALTRALSEMNELGIAGQVPIELLLGPDQYLLGEEKALLEVIEGNDPLPRLIPPYIEGLFATPESPNPAAINNVETLFNVPGIVEFGPDWFRSVGTETSPGTMLFTVVGDVRRPGMYELPLGFRLSGLLFDLAGGPTSRRAIKAVLPGASNAVVTPESFDVRLDFDSMKWIGSGLGSGGLAVYDDTACAVRIAETFTRFLYVESCGQCPPCKLHSGDVSETLARIDSGEADAGDLQEVLVRCSMVTDGQRCGLPDGVRTLVPSLVSEFRMEFEAHLNGRGCPLPRDIPVPKITRYEPAAGFEFDRRQMLKRPDWTYAS